MSDTKQWKSRRSRRNAEPRLSAVSSALPHPEAYARAFQLASRSLPAVDQRIARDRADAGGLVAELEAHPWARRFLLAENRARYQSLGVVEALLQRSRRNWTDDAREAERYAQLSITLLDRLSTETYPRALLHDYQARSWAFVANARRIRSEFDRVEEAFRRAEMYLQSGTGDASELARLLELRASFARATRRCEEAERLLLRVIAIHREVGDRHLEGRALVGLSLLHYTLGDSAQALEMIERAALQIDGPRDPHLQFAVEKNRALFLSSLGRTEEARAALPEVRRLARALGTRLDHLRLLWVSALIHRDRGRTELAEQALRRVRDGFLEERVPFNAALAALDLAALYLGTGRLNETAALARETAAMFSTLQVQPELLAALALFHQAAERKCISVAWVEQLAREVRHRSSAADPHGRGEPDRG